MASARDPLCGPFVLCRPIAFRSATVSNGSIGLTSDRSSGNLWQLAFEPGRRRADPASVPSRRGTPQTERPHHACLAGLVSRACEPTAAVRRGFRISAARERVGAALVPPLGRAFCSKIRSMSFNRCRFCDHCNPADAKFCNDCGGALHLLPCPHCGAVSDIAATICYACRGQLPGRMTGALESAPAATSVATEATPASPASNNATSLSRLPALLILGVAWVVALLGVTGYYPRQHPVVEETRPLSAGSEASEHGTPANTDPNGGAVIATPEDVSEGSEPNLAPPRPACTDFALPPEHARPKCGGEYGSAGGGAAHRSVVAFAPGAGSETVVPILHKEATLLLEKK